MPIIHPVEIGKHLIGTSKLAPTPFMDSLRLAGHPSGDLAAALLWLAFHRLANREQKDGTLTFCVRREELNHVIVEKSQAGRAQ